MGNFHLYQKQRSQNYYYLDRVLKNYVESSGGIFHCYPLTAIVDTSGTIHKIDEEGLTISDEVLNECSARKYSKETFDLWGVTQMKPVSWQYVLAGISDADSDEKTVVLHYNSMIEQLGRKIIVGDVLEISWLRDLDILGSNKAQNKFYVVTDSKRHDQAWAPNYKFHLWELTIQPLVLSTEYYDLINTGEENTFYEDSGSANGGGGIDAENSTSSTELAIMDAILSEAEEMAEFRLHDEHHVYLDENEQIYVENRFRPEGIDGIPAECTCEDIEFGSDFPENPEVGDYFLRTDYNPPRLFKRYERKWQMISYDNREKWTGVANMLRRHINNDETFYNDDGEKITKRQNIKDLVKARVKKEHNRSRDWTSISKIRPDFDVPNGI